MKTGVIETRVARVRLEEDGIVRVVAIANRGEVMFNDAVEILAAHVKVTGGKKLPALIDMRQTGSVSREARQHLAGEEMTSVTSALALLTSSFLSKMVGNLYTGINNPGVPLKLFTSEVKAIEWLKGFLE
ncbi:MAG: hypothetical protein ACFFD4_15290 [Candidatus Odinarchaeota archaeon]